MAQMNLITKQKQAHKYRKQTYGSLLFLGGSLRWYSIVLLSQMFASCLQQGARESPLSSSLISLIDNKEVNSSKYRDTDFAV